MSESIAVIDVVVPAVPVVSVASVGMQGPPGAPGPAGPEGPAGPAGVAGPHQASHAVGGADALTGPLAVSPYVAVGTNPSQGGAVRLPADGDIKFRNGTNTADERFVGFDGANFYVGDPAGVTTISGPVRIAQSLETPYVAVGTNPAQTGAVRLANNTAIMARNTANDADVPIATVVAGDTIVFGQTGATAAVAVVRADTLLLRSNNYGIQTLGAGNMYGMDDNQFYPFGTKSLGLPTQKWETAHVNTAVAVGTNPAQTGAVRLANNQAITARNAANTADYNLIKLTSGAQLELGVAGVVMNLLASTISCPAAQLYPGSLRLSEGAAPAAPGANNAYIYAEDNGAGKTRIMCRFATGAAVQIAIEP